MRAVDDQPVLNVHRLYRAGALIDGTRTRWAWAGQIMTNHAHENHAMITVGSRHMAVPIVWVPGTWGSRWPLWGCTGCARRVWNLYWVGTIGCRFCHQLQHSSHLDRTPSTVARARRLRRRMGASLVPFSPLPPRVGRRGRAAMWYDRAAEEIAQCEMAAALNAVSRLANAPGRGIRRRS